MIFLFMAVIRRLGTDTSLSFLEAVLHGLGISLGDDPIGDEQVSHPTASGGGQRVPVGQGLPSSPPLTAGCGKANW